MGIRFRRSMSALTYDELRFPRRTYAVKRGKLGGLYVRGPRDIKLYLNGGAVPDDIRRANPHLYDDRGELRQEARDWWLRKSRADAGCGRLPPVPDCGATARELERARRTVDNVTRKADALSDNVVALRSEVTDLKAEAAAAAALRAAETSRVKKVDCGETDQKLVAARRTIDEAKQKADALADTVVELRSEVKQAGVGREAAERQLVRARNTVDLMRREIEQLKESDAQARQRRLAFTADDANRVAVLERRVRDLDFEKERLLRSNAHTVRERNQLRRRTEELTVEQGEARRALARARSEVQASAARIQSLETSFSTQAADLVSATTERQRLSELLDAERARNGRDSLRSRGLQERVAALDEQVATHTSELERTHARLLATVAERDAVQTRLVEAQRQLQARPTTPGPQGAPPPALQSHRPTSAPRVPGDSRVAPAPATADRRAAEEEAAEREAVERRQREEKARRELATRGASWPRATCATRRRRGKCAWWRVFARS